MTATVTPTLPPAPPEVAGETARGPRGLGWLSRYLDGADPLPIAVLFGLNSIDEFDTNTFRWIAPTIAVAFGLTVDDFGLITVISLLLAPIMALPVARLADKRSRMAIAIATGAVWATFSLLTGLAWTVWVLFLARVGSDFGRTVNNPVHMSLAADFYHPAVRTKALGLHALANHAGAVFGTLAGAGLAALFGWQWPFLVLILPMIAVLVVARRVSEPPRGVYERKLGAQAPPLREVAPRLWAIRSLRYFWFATIWFNGAVLGAAIILPFHFDEVFGLGTFALGVVGATGAAFAAGAALLGTKLAQDRINQRPLVGVQYIGWTVVGVAVLVAGFALAPNVWIAIPLLWGVLALAGLLDPLSAAVGTMIAPPEMRASAFALGFLIRLVGAPFALLVSIVAGGPGTRWGLLVAVPLLARGALHIFTAGKFVDADVERLDPRYVERERRTDESGRPIILEAKGVAVSYDGVQVLFGVDMSIREGEVVALLGTNGAGKSTTLNAISGLVGIDRGNVWFDGEPISGLAPERIVAAGLVQVPGGRGTWPGLTVAENLRLGAYLLRRDKSLQRARLDDVLEVFPKLRGLLERKAGDLSGGERQMLTLAQAFLLEPKVLLIDELSLGLAPVVVQELLVAVRRLSAEGVTIILVEQSVNVALALADRAYFMEKGRVRFEGATSELLERDDLLRSVFLGGPVDVPAARADDGESPAPMRKGRKKQ